jgi:CD9 antigen
MFAFNFLFWLLGCAILGVGIWVRVDENFKQFVDNDETFNVLYTAAYILIAVGVIIMIIGFLGCCGAIRESQCMLATFFIFLFIIFIVLLGAGIWAIVEKESLKDAVQKTLEENVKNYYSNTAAKSFMDSIQTSFECCGADGSQDYILQGDKPPCELKYFATGCNDKLFAYLRDNMVIIAGVAIGIGVVMLLGMVFSMLMCCALREAMA